MSQSEGRGDKEGGAQQVETTKATHPHMFLFLHIGLLGRQRDRDHQRADVGRAAHLGPLVARLRDPLPGRDVKQRLQAGGQ